MVAREVAIKVSLVFIRARHAPGDWSRGALSPLIRLGLDETNGTKLDIYTFFLNPTTNAPLLPPSAGDHPLVDRRWCGDDGRRGYFVNAGREESSGTWG